MSRSFFFGCIVLVGVAAAGVAALNLSPEGEVASKDGEPTAIGVWTATVVAPGDVGVGPLEKAGRVADDLIERAGLGTGDVEQITETARQIGEKAAAKAGVVVEKVKETANRAIVKAEELAEDGKDAALEAAGDLGDTIDTGK